MLMNEMRDYFSPYADLLNQVKVIQVYSDDERVPSTGPGQGPALSEQKSGEDKTVALIIDDYDRVGRLISLLLETKFDEVIACSDPNAAHTILEKKRVTHLLCDYRLGADEDEVQVNGFQFAAFWRREFESLKRVVVFSASDLNGIEKPEEVDAVISKIDGPVAIADSLLSS